MTTQQQTVNGFEIVNGFDIVRDSTVVVPPVKSFLYNNTIFLPENATEVDLQTAVELYSKPEKELLQMKDVYTKVGNSYVNGTH